MLNEFADFLLWMRPAFSRRATWRWFTIVCAGFATRTDFFGVSSIIRALNLTPGCYELILHFFHSTAWSVDTLAARWLDWLAQKERGVEVNGRLVVIGDHTKTPRDGRKIPALTTLHQESETGSKPSYFRGHHWGCVAMLAQTGRKFCSTPLEARIQEGNAGGDDRKSVPKTIQLVQMAQRLCARMQRKAYFILDAYFSVGPVFKQAARERRDGEQQVHILTRAKKNIVAYLPPPKPRKKKRGRKKKYGRKLKLMKIFDAKAKCYDWETLETDLYGRQEKVRCLALDLLWKPTKDMIRFVLVESSRGRMILMSSDLTIAPVDAIRLYCHRVTIETMFDVLKNTLGGLGYHFWSSHLSPASRKPRKNTDAEQTTSNAKATENTLAAIEKFVNVQLCVLGMLQLIAKNHTLEARTKARCWLRTSARDTPSEFVTRLGLKNALENNSSGFGKNWITRLIQSHREMARENAVEKEAA